MRLFFGLVFLLVIPVFASSGISYPDVPTELSALIESTPELSSMLNEVLALQPDSSFWHEKTADDMVPFFAEWLTSNPTPENPGNYIRLFDELANSNG